MRAPSPVVYRPRAPEHTVLYQAVREHWPGFAARSERAEHPVPKFVEKEMEGFLLCGQLEEGFARVRCDGCGFERLVPFSCKGRGVCCSCIGHRMADTAAHLVDRVIPAVPMRQWVLSLPIPLRYLVAYDAEACTAVLGIFVRTVLAHLRRVARVAGPRRDERRASWSDLLSTEIWLGAQSQPAPARFRDGRRVR